MTKWIFVILFATTLIFGCGKESNPAAPENQPPVISDTHCTIVMYTNGSDIWYGPTGLIYCKVTDPDGLDDIKDVQWVSDYEGGNAFFVSLYDDGTHGDITAGDGTFTLDCDQNPFQYWQGDGEVNGVGAVYYFLVEDKMNHTDETDPQEY